MALASRTLRSIQSINRGTFLVVKSKNHVCKGLLKASYRLLSHVGSQRSGSEAVVSSLRDPAQFFFNDEVQSCLLEMNLRDTSRVFQPRKEGQSVSEVDIKLMTQKQLDEEQNKAMETARYYLQVPPVLAVREDKQEILSQDSALQGLEESKILFTDISYGVPHRERLVVARDPDGTLRHASREEHSRMIQTYFPDSSKTHEPPELFSSPNLKSLWERSEFAFVLDRACAQFEPDDLNYVSITSLTYDCVDDLCKYDVLLGTRHYGALAFYLAFNGRIDKFLHHCISMCRIQDAVTLIKVFYLTRPDIKDFTNAKSADDPKFIQEYISKYSKDNAALSMVLNAYLELGLPTAEETASLSAS